jgi:hypothetical protein
MGFTRQVLHGRITARKPQYNEEKNVFIHSYYFHYNIIYVLNRM